MKDKIKELLQFLVAGWRGGVRGKIGVLCIIFASIMFVRLFWGDVSIQQFVINIWKLNGDQSQLVTEQKKLTHTQHQIKLLHEYSPDYIEELSQKYLNMGAPDIRILK